ncbi:MAG: transposase [Candidatus Methylomirabilales bacterium]
MDALIAEGRRFADPDNARWAKRLRKQRRHLLRFLQVEGVEATNTRAERALRPAVMVRKTGGLYKRLNDLTSETIPIQLALDRSL